MGRVLSMWALYNLLCLNVDFWARWNARVISKVEFVVSYFFRDILKKVFFREVCNLRNYYKINR